MSCPHRNPQNITFRRVNSRRKTGALLGVNQQCTSLSAAGRQLFAVSRAEKASQNDADRLRKYLARFGLDWATVTST